MKRGFVLLILRDKIQFLVLTARLLPDWILAYSAGVVEYIDGFSADG